MKRQDTVFLLTLIDFLFQVIFFGLFVYAIYAAKQDPNLKQALDSLREKYDLGSSDELRKAVEQLPNSLETLQKISANSGKVEKELSRQGVSNIVDLSDELSKLAPVRDLIPLQRAIEKLGGKQELIEMTQLVESAGGHRQAKDLLKKYIKEGVGKPYCDPIVDASGKVVGGRPIATIMAYDNKLVFQGETSQLTKVLAALGLRFQQVEILTPTQFKTAFKSIPTKFPECVHMIAFREATRLVDARDAVRPYFRLSITKVTPTPAP